MIPAYWLRSLNFGDALNPYIISNFANVGLDEVFWVDANTEHSKYMFIGSILSVENLKNTTVYGAGFVSSNSYFTANNVTIKGIRGNLSLSKARQQKDLHGNTNVYIPEDVIIGEPSLCLSKFYKPNIEKKYRLGVLPHYIDNEYCNTYFRNNEDVKIINLLRQENEDLTFFIHRVINEINECEKTISSSLHGLIVSASYGIPTDWCKFSENIIGDGFKFYDFIDSIDCIYEGNDYIKPINLCNFVEPISVDEILLKHRNITNKKIDINKILENKPF